MLMLYCYSVTQSYLDSLQPHGVQHAIPVPYHLLKFAQVHVHCISDAIQPSHPLMPSSPSALNLSQHQGLFQWVVCSHQMTKILELQLQHQSFQWIFRVDLPQEWLLWSPCSPRDFQKSSPAPQFKASILWHSALFTVQLSQPYLTAGKIIVFTIQTFVGKVMSLLFNRLPRLVIAFLPRSKCLLISWLQPLYAVIFALFKRGILFQLSPSC